MTTIEEMDEFFNFEDAAHPLDHPLPSHLDFDPTGLNLPSGPYDINLAFAEPENDENSFTCLQHFSALEGQVQNDTDGVMTDTAMLSPHDFTDFPRWIDGMDFPTNPCSYCSRMRIHCKIIKEGLRRGSCTSCVALARSCSLTHGPRQVVDGKDSHLSGDATQNDFQDLSTYRMDESMNADEPHPSVELTQGFSRSRSNPNLVSVRSSEENINAAAGENPKVGARFSRDSIRILRAWLSTHHRHPYPTDEEKASLKRETGLSKTQITNWLANARRRGKVRAPRSTSPSVSNYTKAMDIPRRSTPAMEHMNPMERWEHSPPENEPASVTAIAKAVTSSTFSSGRESPYTSNYHTDDGSNRSLANVSSTSSFGTSHSSGGSFASAFSHKSKGSFGSFGSFGHRGRRRRRQAPKAVKVPVTNGPVRTFQCTFCTETFKTKHDWQRHEKSLHLSLERWVCCPDGPTQFCSDYDHNRCVFCGLPNPPAGHAEIHNYSSCADRSLEERTFYRKDHLRQHLNLVHDVKFQGFSMESWKIATPQIRSRCGFCGIVMDSWTIRVDHLAEHFKGGKSMADWKGDWGFEPQVLDIIENGMPPYLIHDERNSMEPYEASKDSAASTRTLEDHIKLGLVDYIHARVLKESIPTDKDLLEEAQRIVRKTDLYTSAPDNEVSWFRDLIMFSGKNSDEHVTIGAIPHKDIDLSAISCRKERALKAFVIGKQALGLTPTNSELQVEACRILDEIEPAANFKCKGGLGWFKYLIAASHNWLSDFRRRANLPRLSEMADEHIRSTDDKSIDYSIHNHHRLENELIAWVRLQRAQGIKPSDDNIQRQARLIVYKTDDPWNQTALDNPVILHLFKRQQHLAPENEDGPDMPPLKESTEHCLPSAPSPKTLHFDLEQLGINLASPSSGSHTGGNSANGSGTPDFDKPLHTLVQNQPSTNTNPTQPLGYFLNDANCYGRLVRELSRFVTACMSVNSPNRHVPSDAEIQNHARWTIYDDDDPWNQTAADNAEWLIRFKRDVGLAAPEEGPGLPVANSSWQVSLGGSGFYPPYLHPKEPPASYVEDVSVRMEDRVYNIKATTAQKFLKSMSTRYQPPAAVFCSRELETGLNEFMVSEMVDGMFPSDEALKAEARKILGVENTAADDVQLLEKFKSMHRVPSDTSPVDDSISNFNEAEMLAELDHELAKGNLGMSGPATQRIPFNDSHTPGIPQSQQTQQAMHVAKGCADLYRAQGGAIGRDSFPMTMQGQLPSPQVHRSNSNQNGTSPSMPGFPSSGSLL
ncbi:Uncharacterized protein BP5553_06453 [Venustampulla echinocandica]|uniref:Uncharacterized protein n=1 Tax=Venustampulla echinocandica TaxID=2656787 RepID=A0A370TJY5_9HELO|nr:Uncharacterized protein BP5553_06453 [Venustampulla echinocandica]RDL35841.1 Uncharacterized protein BP5553_06453 [Venustampulla echinocandica]